MQTNHLSRRDFLAGTSAAMGAMALPNILWSQSPNEKLNLAFIGVGGRGLANLNTITRASNENIVALCDVDATSLGKAKERFPKAGLTRISESSMRKPRTLMRSSSARPNIPTPTPRCPR